MADCDVNKTDAVLGQYLSGGPAYTGKLNCKCVIFPDCPIFQRKLQDEHYVFSPETIDKAPSQMREKIEFIRNTDGLYLSPIYIYRHNFLAGMRKEDDLDEDDKRRARGDEKLDPDQNVSLTRLEFIQLADESLVDKFLNRTDLGAGEIMRPYSFRGAEPAHHMWIDDGSLFVSETIRPSDFDQPLVDKAADLKRMFYPRWEYYLHNAPSDPVSTAFSWGTPTSDVEQDNYKHMPYQSKVSPGDPVVFLDKLRDDDPAKHAEFITGESRYYRNINPGIHWRVLKRTPLFRGEDFWVEFHKKSLESDISVSKNAKFKTRDGYEFLDPYYQSEALGEVPNSGIVEVGSNREKIEESLKAFDLSDQAYYIIEIGHKDHIHNYFLILAEREHPILCHAGHTWIRKVDDEATSTAGSTASAGEDDCVEDPEAFPRIDWDIPPVNSGSTTKVEFSTKPILRRLGRFKYASSRRLMQQDRLRITVRQHLGKLVITFSEHEDNPWVITRSDLSPRPESGDSPEAEEDFQVDIVPMVIPRKRIALMGGNSKTAFSFGPLNYKSLDFVWLDQRLSVPGPVDFDDIHLLLRDKGVTRDPSAGSRDVEYSQEAEVYSEFVDGHISSTLAIDAQPGVVETRGKAPDMQRINDRRRRRSTMQLEARDCARRVGSGQPYVKVVEVCVSMVPGDYIFKPPVGDFGKDWICKDCITPIMTGFRLYVPPEGQAFASPAVEVGHHVMKISESWQETDMLRIQHSGRIQFLINHGMDSRFSDDRPNQSNYLRKLSDRNFYIQLSVWWDEGGCMPVPALNRDRVIFTGICTNSSITEENGKHIMTCDMQDYTKVLEQQFFNSPFFDKMRDFNAVYEIIKMAGFRDDSSSQPGSLLKRLSESEQSGWFQLPHNGETIYNQEYSLPGSYNILHEPCFKFRDGSTFAEAVNKIGQISGKVVYFDRLGVFHYEKLPYDQELFGGQQGSSSNFTIKDWSRLSKVDFFASPKDVSSGEGGDLHKMVYDSYTVTRDMDSVINRIMIISTSPEGGWLSGGHSNFDSFFDIEKPGFIGYPKTLLQMDGIFGDEQNVKWMIKHYTKLFLPPVKIRFKSIGHNLLKALDIVTFRGLGWRDKQVLIVGSINSEIDPQTQTWWQDLECYWIFPSQNIDWGTTREITLGTDGSTSG